MDQAIFIFERIRSALGTVQITSTRSNLDTMLGCMQLCDKGIAALHEAKAAIDANKMEEGEKE